MKNKALLIAFLVYILTAMTGLAIAQNLQLKAKIILNGKASLEKIDIKLVRVNNNMITSVSCVSTLNVDLPYNDEYLVVFSKEGYQSKYIVINTMCTLNTLFRYNCIVDLKPKEVLDDVPLQAGGIYFNKNKNEFDYYLN